MNQHDDQHDDLERTVARSLGQRTERASTSVPDLDGVWTHVDRRRSRRRHVAAVGSLAVVAVGALGVASLGGGDTNRIPAPAASPDVQAAWRCMNQLDYFEEGSPAVFFSTCEPAEVDGSARAFDLPSPTTPADMVATTAPYPTTTTIVCLAPASVPTTASADAVATTVPCGWWGTPPTTPVQEVRHQVEAGETLASISAAYGIPVEEIVALNPWGGRSDVTLVEGETIMIALRPISPTSTEPELMPTTTTIAGRSVVEQEYTVQPGDSIASIADRYGITLEQLINYNQLSDGADHLLLPGEQLLVPPAALVPSDTFPVTTTTEIP